MMGLFRFICILLLPGLITASLQGSNEAFEKAEDLFAAALYQESIPFYLQVKDPVLQPQALLQLAKAYFFIGCYTDTLNLVEQIPLDKLDEKEKEEATLLHGLSQRHFANYSSVVSLLSNYFFTVYSDEAAFELGLAYFMLGDVEKATRCFSRLDNAMDKPDLYTLSRFYLTRLALEKNDLQKAQSIIETMPEPQSDGLKREYAFLSGSIDYKNGDYVKACEHFVKALPKKNGSSNDWESETLYHIGWCYSNLAEAEGSLAMQADFLKKAEEIFSKLTAQIPEERFFIALAHTHILKGDLLKDSSAYPKADQILKNFTPQKNQESSVQFFLIQAEASRSYSEREAIYKKITDNASLQNMSLAKGSYYKALNDFQRARQQKSPELYEKAISEFENAQRLLEASEDKKNCIKYYAQACWEKGSIEGKIQALSTLQEAIDGNSNSEDLNDLYDAYATLLIRESLPEGVLKKIQLFLTKRAKLSNAPGSVLSLASFLFKLGMYADAYAVYMEFAARFPESPNIPAALLQASLALELSQGNSKEIVALRKRVYEEYGASSSAPKAYFIIYTYQDYLQGNREAIKHLESFKKLFPDSPLLINVDYLLGLDLKRDRRTPEGKSIRKKAPAQSIQAFQNVENSFERLYALGKIMDDEIDYYSNLCFRAALERGLIHYEIAEESNSAKREIYFQYAIDTLTKLKNDLGDSSHPVFKAVLRNKEYSGLQEECDYWLAMSYLKSEQIEKGKTILHDMLARYSRADLASGYYLSRIYYELGMLENAQGDYKQALAFLLKSEESSKNKFLSVDEKLDLLLSQSECYKKLGQPENAMLVLSKVINDDSVSHLRLKAMFMRAALYEMLNRPELARRQLEAVAKMDGKWAEMAKLKLENDYAIH